MSAGLVAAVVMALAFAFTNGIHDAADAIATLVVTRAASPVAAVTLAAAGNIVGPLLLGAAVADTVAGVVTVPDDQMVFTLGAALTGAVVWNGVTWWKGLPSSSSHALLGGLVGAAVAQGGTGAVNWGGFDGIKPVGVFGIRRFARTVVGFGAGVLVNRGAPARPAPPVAQCADRCAPTVAGVGRACAGHGANDAQKSVGIVAYPLRGR
ncbi:MAG: inorganic phosphate transporter [Acidimicrobiia bacterium]